MLQTVRAGVKTCISCVLGAVVVGLIATPAASAQQSIGFTFGGFFPRAVGARVPNDVLVNDLTISNVPALPDVLLFNVSDFRAASVGAEYLVGLGNLFEAGVSAGFQQRSVPSVYANYVNTNDGSEIEQTLKLRVIPVTATFRFLPLGHRAGIVPYVGGGVGVFTWRYSETGNFLDPPTSDVFPGDFVGSGTATGPVILGGVRTSGAVGVGGEVRWQHAEGLLPANTFVTDLRVGDQPKIDLGGFTAMFTVNVRF
jgi:outer membrane protein W